MVRTAFEVALAQVQSRLAALRETLEDSVRTLLEPPPLILSRILLAATLLSADREISEKTVASCCALELLENALFLGAKLPHEEGNLLLLASDHLYACAIDQVIDIEEPFVIGALAAAIMATGQDRAVADYVSHRRRLITAALEIGRHLANLAPELDIAIEEAAKRSFGDTQGGWLSCFPSGPVRDYLEVSIEGRG